LFGRYQVDRFEDAAITFVRPVSYVHEDISKQRASYSAYKRSRNFADKVKR
jgi:hypothetical protein